MIHLFPFEKVEKGSKIVIYGAGNVGSEYAAQLLKTGYCEIVCVLDKGYEKKDYWKLKVHPPEKILEEHDYDYVIIAMDSKRHARDVVKTLEDWGVPRNKIISLTDRMLHMGYMYVPKFIQPNTDPDIFRIGIYQGGGMGSAIIDLVFIKEIRKLFVSPVQIDFYCTGNALFYGLPFLDNVYPKSELFGRHRYDVFITMSRLAIIDYIDRKKTRKTSRLFYDYCTDMTRMLKMDFQSDVQNAVINQYALIKGKKRPEHYNLNGLLPITGDTPTYMDWAVDGFEFLFKHNLDKAAYITVSRAVSAVHTENNPKLWPLKYYKELLKLIKNNYPDILIVRVDADSEGSGLDFVDIDLAGKTSFDELKVVLKYSLLNISAEGGLVHLKYFLNGKSVVLFGPTIPKVWGYDGNINLRTEACPNCANGCEALTDNWASTCMAGLAVPKCMETLYPERVFGEISKFLDDRTEYEYLVAARISETDMKRYLPVAGKIAHIYREKVNLLLRYSDGVGEITIFDRDLSVKTDANTSNNCIYIDVAKSIAANANAEYGFIYNIPVPDGSFDAVVNFTLDDEKYQKFALREMMRVTRPGGKIIARLNDLSALAELGVKVEPGKALSSHDLLVITKE
jgi:ADP-heptose:LPS heptosyltransferase